MLQAGTRVRGRSLRQRAFAGAGIRERERERESAARARAHKSLTVLPCRVGIRRSARGCFRPLPRPIPFRPAPLVRHAGERDEHPDGHVCSI